MEKEIRFCNKCGMKLIRKERDMGFDPYTGKKLYMLRCPSGLCEHVGIDHKEFSGGACKGCGIAAGNGCQE